LHLETANSTEFDAATKDPVICLMSEQQNITTKGANMRLGSYLCTLVQDTHAHNAYKTDAVLERHRHRYEVNKNYKERLEKAGIVFSGIHTAMDLIEIAEVKDHPFMVGSQFHPEFQSSPVKVHPLFKSFIEVVASECNKRQQQGLTKPVLVKKEVKNLHF